MFTAVAVIFTCSCSKDQNIEEQPSEFEARIENIASSSADLTWTVSTDPQGSTVFYDVYLEGTKWIDNTTRQSFTFTELEEGMSYKGRIVASDPEGNTRTVTFEFETSINQPPSPFDVNVVITHPFFSKIEWTTAEDPEGGDITYNIYLDNELFQDNHYTMDFTFPELKGQTLISGHVEAVDPEGKSRTVPFAFNTDSKVYDDDLKLENQDMVEEFGSRGFNIVEGSVIIGSYGIEVLTDVSDLSTLQSLQVIKGNLYIRNTACESLSGLENVNLTNSFAELLIAQNNQLSDVNGLEGIVRLYEIDINQNEQLAGLGGLSNLSAPLRRLNISHNPSLYDLSGLEGVSSVTELDIRRNDQLLSLQGLQQISSASSVNIGFNPSLINMEGLRTLESCSSLIISNNATLQDLTGFTALRAVGTLRVTENPALTTLNGLENLIDVNHTVAIIANENLASLNGIRNIQYSDNQADYHVLAISNNGKITNLDAVANYTFNRGNISIGNNSMLTDLCGLTKILSEINIREFNENTFISGNAYNPTIEQILQGDCAM